MSGPTVSPSISSARGRDSPGSGPGVNYRYELLDKIGRGGFGFVYRALDREQGRVVAAKLIDLEEAGDEMEDVQQEIQVMSSSHCPQLTEYYTSFVRDNQLWIIMEHLEAGSLADVMKDFGPLSEPSCAYVIRELLLALVYLHSGRKIHRDIKAGNILVSGAGLIKLSDFGVTGQLTDSMNKRKTRVGTPFWMAPEVITETSYDENADIWSVGITAIELAKGFPPHAKSMHPMQVIFLIPKQPPPVLEGAFSAEFKNFVATCLQKDPAGRPSSASLLNHPFLSETYLTDELKQWATQRVLKQEEQLKALERDEQQRQLARRHSLAGRKDGSRSSKNVLVGGPGNISELRTLETSRVVDRPTPKFDYEPRPGQMSNPNQHFVPPPPAASPIKRASPSSVRGLGRDPLATALAAANAAAALSAATASGGNINISGSVNAVSSGGPTSPYLSPRSECDISYNYSMESGHDGDSNNTSGWDFDLTIKTRNSQGSQYSYSYSGKNFPDLSVLSADGVPLQAGGGAASLQSPRYANNSASNISNNSGLATGIGAGGVKKTVSIDSTLGSTMAAKKSGHDVPSAPCDAADHTAAAAHQGADDAVIIEESTLRQYNDLDPPMTDGEAFSAVLGVLTRFKWQFVDRTPHTSDLPRSTDPVQAKQMRRAYRQYIKQLDTTLARNPGGVEYSRDSPLRPSALYKEVVVPAMGSVGSAAAVVLGTDLMGGSGLRGMDLSAGNSISNIYNRSSATELQIDGDRCAELPPTPVTLCSVVDLIAGTPPAESGSTGSVKKNKREPVSTKDKFSGGLTNGESSDPQVSLGGGESMLGCCGDGAGDGPGTQPQVSPRPTSLSRGSSTGEADVYESADALLTHLYTAAAPGISSSAHAVSVVELERRRDRESRALLWALERCLLALDIQSGGGATSEVLSTLMGYMMDGMEGDDENATGEDEDEFSC